MGLMKRYECVRVYYTYLWILRGAPCRSCDYRMNRIALSDFALHGLAYV